MPANIGLSRYRLWIAFLLSLSPLLFLPIFLPTLRLNFFAPYIVICCYQCSFFKTLWQAVLCGFVIDILSSHPLFGLSALNNCLAVSLIYFQNRNFFEDRPSTLPLMTFFFSLLSSGTYAILLGLTGQNFSYSWHWVLTDLLLMPLLDAAFAFLWYSLPFQLYHRVSRLIKYAFIWNTRSRKN